MRPIYKIHFLLFCSLFGLMHYSCKQKEKKGEKTLTEIPSRLKEIVNKIANYNRVDTRGVGFAGVKTQQYERFEKLVKYAKPEELIGLTDHQSPVVRAYSFWALAEIKFPGLKLIVKKHANDTSSFEFLSGCILMQEKINNFYIAINKNGG